MYDEIAVGRMRDECQAISPAQGISRRREAQPGEAQHTAQQAQQQSQAQHLSDSTGDCVMGVIAHALFRFLNMTIHVATSHCRLPFACLLVQIILLVQANDIAKCSKAQYAWIGAKTAHVSVPSVPSVPNIQPTGQPNARGLVSIVIIILRRVIPIVSQLQKACCCNQPPEETSHRHIRASRSITRRMRFRHIRSRIH